MEDRMILIQEEPRGPSYLIEIQCLVGAANSVPIPPIQELVSDDTQKVVIKSVRLVTLGELTSAPVSGLANAPLAELQKMSLTLYAEGWEKMFNCPILSLNNVFTEGSGIPFRDRSTKLANWIKVAWNKSKIQFGASTPPVGLPYAVLLEVEYERFDLNDNIIKGGGA